jgi:energy-converting hydrogenase Eha subunit G
MYNLFRQMLIKLSNIFEMSLVCYGVILATFFGGTVLIFFIFDVLDHYLQN